MVILGDLGQHLAEVTEIFFSFERFSGFAGESFKLFFVHDYCLSLTIAGGYDKQLHSLIYSLCSEED